MRATYEGLLTVAHRQALEAVGRVSTDTLEIAAGWSAVLSATRRQLDWLSWELETQDVAVQTGFGEGDAALRSVARLLGAATDLLASQDVLTASAFDHRGAVSAARRAVAKIASVAAGAALRALKSADEQKAPVQVLIDHLRTAQLELRQVTAQNKAVKLGPLGALATSMPVLSAERFAEVAYLAAQWQRHHEQVPPGSLLTRDLRSITAQVRTAAGHSRFLVDAVVGSAQRLGLNGPMVGDLRAVGSILRRADQGAIRSSAAWQRHLSDLGGRTSLPGEFTFAQLHNLFRDAVTREGRVIPASELIPSQETARAILDAVDELVHSARQVARVQREAVAGLIKAGRLFVSHRVLARVDPAYVKPPGARAGRLHGNWVWTTRQDCFTELTEALSRLDHHLGKAAEVSRRLAGTGQQGRPSALAVPARPRRPVIASGVDPSRDLPTVELL